MPRPIKTLCITEDADRPTTATFIGLAQAGVDVTVMCPAASDRRAALDRKPAFACSTCRCASASTASGIAELRAELVRGGYDILHLFSNKAVQNGLIASRGLPVKIVAYRGIVGNVSFFNPVSWRRFLNPRIDRIVCVANAVRDYFLQMQPAFLRLPAEKLVTIYKGHSLDWYRATPADLAQRRRAAGQLRHRLRGELSSAQGHRVARRRVPRAAGRVAGASALDRRRHGRAGAHEAHRREPGGREYSRAWLSQGFAVR